MKNPFNIFPKIGYRNSQFQVVSTTDNLIIEIYDKDKIVKSIETNSKYPTLLTNLNTTGKLLAKCMHNNETFQQEIEIKEAYRFGSSEFKKAFVFDDAKYSFFLMKDRLLLYYEEKKILLTENHYSPTEIHRVNKTNYLFVTRVGTATTGIVNLGIYNTETFALDGELLNGYQEIKILSDSNKAWLYNVKSKTIQCFELVKDNNRYFTELKKHQGFIDFFIDDFSQNLFINYSDRLNVSNLSNLHNAVEIPKLKNNAIDKLGNIFTIERNSLICTKCLTDYSVKIKSTFELNLQQEDFIHIGDDLKIELIDLNNMVEEIKEKIISSIPDNKTYYYHKLPESQRISESCITHRIYPTIGGLFVIQEELRRDFSGVRFTKYQDNWTATPKAIESNKFSLLFFNSDKVEVLIDKASTFTIREYHNSMLLVNSQNTKRLFSGNNEFTIENDNSIELFTVNEISYFLIKSKGKHSLFRSTNFKNPILEQIEILNPDLVEKHSVIWYSGKEKDVSKTNYLNGFDLKTCSRVFFDERKMQHSLFKDSTDFRFYDEYALSSNQILFNPSSLEIKDAIIGKVEWHSNKFDKIVSLRDNIIYLSVFNDQTPKYELSEIPLDNHRYNESYLSPNGQFLVLQDENNKYIWYNIETSETISFISGNFLAFKNDGSLIVEEDNTKAVKIIDPKTFQDITPPNYHHYRFISPDGKLYAQVVTKVRYFNKLTGEKITADEFSRYRRELDDPNSYLQEKEREQAKLKVEENRRQIFETYRSEFKKAGIEDYININSSTVVKTERYTELGIVGTDVTAEILFPEDLTYYNYSAFSYNNKYFGYVGKPSSKGLIHLFKIDFDEVNSKLTISDAYLSRYPRYASWVCGFSKTGYFATYDSTPDTYILQVDDGFFENKTSETELEQNLLKSDMSIYSSYNEWNEIKGKSFLCFSPSGDFLALSEQGYHPLTLGGYGHKESNAVHIAKTNTGQLLDSFTEHGDKIKDDKKKKVTYVAFSEDEKRIMTLSSDGVVIVRDIKIKDIKEQIEN